MVHIILVQLIALLLTSAGWAKMDRIHAEGYLGERDLDSYQGRRKPVILLDFYRGKLEFQDEAFYQNYFTNYVFNREPEYTQFFRSELAGGMTCSNEQLSEHYDQIQYSYRLITLSYLMEGQWHMDMLSKHLNLRQGCKFDFTAWLNKCQPKSSEMKRFVALLKKYKPKYEESLPKTYIKSDWWKDFSKKNFKYYSHYRMDSACKGKCSESEIDGMIQKSCQQDEQVMQLICSEVDAIYGLSKEPDAYYLIGTSNIINTYNKQGEAMGCLRRFSEVMAHKEVNYPVLSGLFKPLRAHLFAQYQERFLQGRVFFYGSGKEFEEKGLKELYVMEQPLKVAQLNQVEAPVEVVKPKKVESKPKPKEKVAESRPTQPGPKKEIVEMHKPVKSAFLQAAEARKASNMEAVEVDMLKLRYDYVFTLSMINTLSEKLKSFMTREALREMMTFDKLGTPAAPVPLLFLKYMIDMQEHTGLYNLISILGDTFYVSNEIDSSFAPDLERVRIVNNDSTGRQWVLYVVKP